MPEAPGALGLAPAAGSRRGSFRVALRMARRDISRHKGRSFLIVLLIMLPVAGMTGAGSLYQSSQRTPEEIVRFELGSTQARFSELPVPNGDSVQDPLNDAYLVSSTGLHDPDFQATAPEDLLPDGYEVLPMRRLQLTTGVGAAVVSLQGRVVDALHPAFAGRFTLLDGRAPAGEREVLVSPGLLERFDLQLGQEFTTSAGTHVPVGTIRDADESDGNSTVFLKPGEVPESPLEAGPKTYQSTSYYLVGPEPVSWQQVRDANSKGVGVLSRAVVLDPPPLQERAVPGATPQDPAAGSVAAYATVALIGALALLEVGLLAGAAFAVGARQQVRELALLAASGAETSTIRSTVMAAGLWLGGIAVTCGAAAGLGAAAAAVAWVRFTGSVRLAGFHPHPALAAAAMLMGLAACLFAAMAPANHVARQAVLGALKSGRAPAPTGRGTVVAGSLLLITAAVLLLAGWLPAQMDRDPDRLAAQAPLAAALLAGGALLAVVALVLLTGWLVGFLTSRTQGWPLSLRLAARDAARNRGRTVPAVAAVLAAATLASAALVLSASQQAGLRDNHMWTALENQVYLPLALEQPPRADGSTQPLLKVDAAGLSTAVEGALGTVAWTHVVTAPVPVRNCMGGPDADLALPARTDTGNCVVYSLAKPEGRQCPATAEGRTLDPTDWRCRGSMVDGHDAQRAVLVGGAEDIRAAFGTDAGADALAVLDAGGMVVTNPVFVDGGEAVLQARDVRSQFQPASGAAAEEGVLSSVSLTAAVVEPAEAVPFFGIVSPETAERLDMRPEATELLVQLGRFPSAAEADTAAAAVAGVYKQPGAGFWVEPGISRGDQWMGWSIVAVSALITFSAAGIATGLSLADARSDHMTLAGVGASPRLRKALAGAQALLTSGLGVLLGSVAGGVPAALIASSTEMRTAVDIPWLHLLILAVGVPLIGAGLAWLCTRAVLPMSRRALAG